MMCEWMQDCGHADFCFACVQGLTSCPTCSTTIKGWHLLEPNSPPVNPLVLSLSAAFNSSIMSNNSNQMTTRKNKKRGLKCVEAEGDDPILGNSSLTDSDDDDAGLLTWVATLEKDPETQVSNLESETQLVAPVDNAGCGLALHNESQDTQEDNTTEVKRKKKRPTEPAPFPRVQTRMRGPPAPLKGKKMMKLS